MVPSCFMMLSWDINPMLNVVWNKWSIWFMMLFFASPSKSCPLRVFKELQEGFCLDSPSLWNHENYYHWALGLHRRYRKGFPAQTVWVSRIILWRWGSIHFSCFKMVMVFRVTWRVTLRSQLSRGFDTNPFDFSHGVCILIISCSWLFFFYMFNDTSFMSTLLVVFSFVLVVGLFSVIVTCVLVTIVVETSNFIACGFLIISLMLLLKIQSLGWYL